MKRVMICIVMLLCLINVNASRTYTQKEFLEGGALYVPQDKIVFDNEVNVTIYDINNQPVVSGLYKELALPEYTSTYASFKGGWVSFHSFKNEMLNRVSFKAVFQTHLKLKETSESYILSVDSKEVPFQEYTCDWFRSGLGFGYSIGGANALTWIIAKERLKTIDSNIENGIEIALAIRKNNSRTIIISDFVKLTLPKPEYKPVETLKPVEPEISKKKKQSKLEDKPVQSDTTKPKEEFNKETSVIDSKEDSLEKTDSIQTNGEKVKSKNNSNIFIITTMFLVLGVCSYMIYRKRR